MTADTDVDDVDDVTMRLRFYGAGDFATYWQIQKAADLIQRFNPSAPPDDVNGILEIHNARLFVEAGFTPKDLPEAEHTSLTEAARPIRRVVAQWFHALKDEDLDDKLSDVDWQYHEHLLDLLAALGVFGRCSATPMLAVLDRARIHPGDLLTSKRLVENYDTQVRDLLLANPDRAELVIRHHLEDQVRNETFLPASLTPADQRELIQKYIDSDNPNGNYLKLVANAPIDDKTGVDKRLIVKAKRRYDAQVKEFFATNTGITTGCSVSVSDTQIEPMMVSLDDTVIEYTFSEAWLEDTLDYASVLNNFQFLFEFAPEDGLLTLPAVDSERRGLESVFGLNGTHDYLTGHVFTAKDLATLSQTVMYRRFLEARDIDLEEVLRWYFEEHLPSELGITGFAFTPSSSTANYLERCRNLFAEMESIATQYNLFIEDGEIDHDVATAGADLVRYRDISSAIEGKYAYATDHPEIQSILHTLFSDQSHLTYVDENLSGDNAVDLLVRNEVPYEALHAFQQPMIDKLIEIGLAKNTGQRIVLTNFPLFSVLRSLSHHEAVAYHHLDHAARAHVDAMIDAGWLVRRSSLLTEAEAAYFNYNLNSVDFSNGPKLRNKYQHGVQPKGEGEAQHQDTYYRALRLMIALTIKINDELVLTSTDHGISTTDETPADRDN
ncbi:hypothetical protein [Nocardioides stalactiti]|uniref:hypothetical protein n=1 Tax=Nocardioides stalactiti TaxID=2755356 RepID=UPI0016007C62|nr:hypothetical protein [Nocardioides stalactiti]